MEAIDQALIERYLANEMTATERKNFEQRLALETELQQEFEEYRLVMDAVKIAERAELLHRFRQRDKILDRQSGDRHPGRSMNLWLLSAAAVLAIIIAWRFLTLPVPIVDQANGTPKDTTSVKQNLPLIKDTIQSGELKKDIKDEEKITRSKDKGKELFADNFEPYRDESMNPTSRADEDELTEFEKFQLSYWKGNYSDALIAFQKLSLTQQENDNLRFLQANTLMAAGQVEAASVILNDVSNNPKSIYHIEALYYLALCDVRNDQFVSARKILSNYINAPDALQKEKAKTLLTDLP